MPNVVECERYYCSSLSVALPSDMCLDDGAENEADDWNLGACSEAPTSRERLHSFVGLACGLMALVVYLFWCGVLHGSLITPDVTFRQ
jgi:hypothetical protein